jgi:regulator of protease activity HflC (stomatin/prohibitin superfamily)
MADSGVFRINPLQGWQREAILKAAQLLRDRFGNPPVDAQARSAHDGLLEVLDPSRRTVRLQKELSEATRKATMTERAERRARERRATDRRKVNLGPPPGTSERRKGERRTGGDRRTRR